MLLGQVEAYLKYCLMLHVQLFHTNSYFENKSLCFASTNAAVKATFHFNKDLSVYRHKLLELFISDATLSENV